MSKIYEVRSIARGDGKPHSWGAGYSFAKAETRLAERATGENKEWADKYHERWWIEEIDTTGLAQPLDPKERNPFQLPSPPRNDHPLPGRPRNGGVIGYLACALRRPAPCVSTGTT